MVAVVKNTELINKAKESLMKAEQAMRVAQIKSSLEIAKASVALAKAHVESAKATAAPYIDAVKKAEGDVVVAARNVDVCTAQLSKVKEGASIVEPKTRAPRQAKPEAPKLNETIAKVAKQAELSEPKEPKHESVEKKSAPVAKPVAAKPEAKPATKAATGLGASLGVTKESLAKAKAAPFAKSAIKGGAAEAPTSIGEFEKLGESKEPVAARPSGATNGVKVTPRPESVGADTGGAKTAEVVAKGKGKPNPHAGVKPWWQTAKQA